MNIADFQALIRQEGARLYRDMPWRATPEPYYVLVSELMLQQTQVSRVIPKFEAFIARFPDIPTLASASLADVLILWSGLGYNRRAKYLHEAARKIMTDFDGTIPSSPKELMRLPGVGLNTAGAIATYGFNLPVAFIETNIREVFFRHIFADASQVHDKELLEVVRKTLDIDHPREWYWALMDYGSFLKRTRSGIITKSAHYKKQSALSGSIREVRGQIIRALSEKNMPETELLRAIKGDDRFENALRALIAEGLVKKTNNQLHLTK